MFSTLVVLLTLAADPTSSSPDSKAPTTASEPTVELVVPERMIEDFLSAASPYKRTLTQDVNVLGFSKKVQLNLRLTDPKVKVTPEAVFVTLTYDLKGPGGITSRGRATPRMVLRVVEGKGLIEGRLTDAKLSAAGGIDIPVDDLIEPVRFPAETSGPLAVGDTKLQAAFRASDVELEKGQVRIKGLWTFKPAETTVSTTASNEDEKR